jgi:hypothetical protein
VQPQPAWPLLGIVDVRRIRRPYDPVETEEEDERGPCSTLVPIGEGVVPCEATGEHRRLVDDVGVELLAAEAAEGACSAESARSILAAFETTAASIPVTCSASQRYSAG